MSTIVLTATTESNPQIIKSFQLTSPENSSWYQELRCVAWISQQTKDKNGNYSPKTTVKFKWVVYQYYYYVWNNASLPNTISLESSSKTISFTYPFVQSNGTRNMCSAQTLGTFSHDTSGSHIGEYNGGSGRTISFSGTLASGVSYSGSETIKFPKIAQPPSPQPDPQPDPQPEPQPAPEPPTPLVFDNIPFYYIYAGEWIDDSMHYSLIYVAGIEGYDVLNPKLTLEVNKAGSLTFDVPVGSEMYEKLQLMKTTIECRQGNEILFRGRVLSTKRNIYNTLTYYCEGFLSWMIDRALLPYSRTSMSARDLFKDYIDRYNRRATDDRKLTYIYSDITALVTVEQKEHSTAWDELKTVLIDGVGGYVVPYLTASETGVQYLSTYGANTEQVVQFGTNLLDFGELIDASDIFTAVRAYGKEINGERVKLRDQWVKDEEAIALYGRIERTAIFNEVTDQDVLEALATQYLRLGTSSAMTLSVKAVDLHLLNPAIERIRIGDQIRVISVPHNVDAYFMCTKAVIDLQDAGHTIFTLGSTQRTISELTDPSYKKFVITEGA